MTQRRIVRKRKIRNILTSIKISSTPKKSSAGKVKNRALFGETNATTSVESFDSVKFKPMLIGAAKRRY